MTETDAAIVRGALRKLATRALLAGMRAFDHPPRGCSFPDDRDRSGCFCCEALSPAKPEAWRDIDSPLSLEERYALSDAYEGEHVGSDNTWFRLECIRELAERGVTHEPAASVAVPASPAETDP